MWATNAILCAVFPNCIMLRGISQPTVNPAFTKLPPAFEYRSHPWFMHFLTICISFKPQSFAFASNFRGGHNFCSSIYILPGARWVDCSTPVWWLTCIYVDRVLCLHYLPCCSTPVGCALAISRPCLRWQIQDWPSPHSTLHSHTPQSQMGKRGFPEKSSSPAIFLFVIRGYIQIWHIIATWDWTFNIGIPLMFHFYFNIRGSFYTG